MDVRAKLFTLVVLAAGCEVGEVPSDPGTTPDASLMQTSGGGGEASFNSMIKPIVGSCTGCHSGSTAPNLTSFANLQAKYKMKPGSSNILVTKGNHQGVTYLSPANQTIMRQWIDSL